MLLLNFSRRDKTCKVCMLTIDRTTEHLHSCLKKAGLVEKNVTKAELDKVAKNYAESMMKDEANLLRHIVSTDQTIII